MSEPLSESSEAGSAISAVISTMLVLVLLECYLEFLNLGFLFPFSVHFSGAKKLLNRPPAERNLKREIWKERFCPKYVPTVPVSCGMQNVVDRCIYMIGKKYTD